jgi:hypothetical protein
MTRVILFKWLTVPKKRKLQVEKQKVNDNISCFENFTDTVLTIGIEI